MSETLTTLAPAGTLSPAFSTCMTAPFLMAVCRPPGTIAADEQSMISQWGALHPLHDLTLVSLLDAGAPDPADLDLARDYSGVIITGSPFGFGHHHQNPAPEQRRLTERVLRLAARLVAEDVPTLGLCFGLQAIVLALGGTLRDDVGEDLQAPTMTVTEAGRRDPLTRNLTSTFRAYVGHSQSVGELPGDGVVLATGRRCPIQMVRWGRHVYGTQFHPEITTAGMRVRIEAYGDTYYPAAERAAVLERCDSADVTAANRLVTDFVERYRRPVGN